MGVGGYGNGILYSILFKPHCEESRPYVDTQLVISV